MDNVLIPDTTAETTFMRRVAERILPLSLEHLNVKQAFTEWEYEGVCFDLGEPSADCELCDHLSIRFQFEITNKHNFNKLLVGSQCIERFEIGGLEGMEKVQNDLNKMYETARNKRVLLALDALILVEPEFSSLRLAYLKEKGFHPKELLGVFPRLVAHGISFLPQDFIVRLRRNKDKEALFSTTKEGYGILVACMSAEQRKKYPAEVWAEVHNRLVQKQLAKQEQARALEAQRAAFYKNYKPLVSIVSPPPPVLPQPPSPPAPAKSFGLKSKYHGKCSKCGKDTFEQLIQRGSKGWEHVTCAEAEAHAP